jgi:adenylate cyclase
VIIIDIDDRSLAEIGQWPWPRNQLAKLTDQAYAAAALGFDIVFAEADRTNPENFIFSYPLTEASKKNYQNYRAMMSFLLKPSLIMEPLF